MTSALSLFNRPAHWWWGRSGLRRLFSVYRLDEFFDFDGVVYILARARSDGLYDVLYIGQSGEGDVRLSSHEKMAPARRLGATHVHVYFIEDRAERFRIETELRHAFDPPMNRQPVPTNHLKSELGALSLAAALWPPSPLAPYSLSDAPAPRLPLTNALLSLGMPTRQPSNSLIDSMRAYDVLSPLERALYGRRD